MKTTEIFTSNLPVGEKLSVKRTRFEPKVVDNKKMKRISIVSGIHGDELEGQLVIYLLAQWLNKNSDKLKGIVDIYPAVNSLGVDTITRGFPLYEVDLNRTFPGSANEFLPGQVVHALANDVKGSDIAIDIHSSNIFLREIPQIRINKEYSKSTLPLAKELNCDFIWIHDAVTVLEATFSHTMNSMGTKTLVVEMGVGMRLTKEYGNQLLTGILNLMKKEQIIECDEEFVVRTPFSSEIGDVFYLNAPKSGLFVPALDHCAIIKEGDKIGDIVDPLTGTIYSTLKAPNDGILFTLREYPVVYEGSLIARIFGEKSGKN
ncbi:M14 family metallopeptidase [Arcobacter cloacae]|uniref:Succinylglutamate desuccinylase n=1 Tax=Arcobacter cloacae TaxID=1054034 RepID=A0A6M8NI98_9BACT|nr:M14 family metallopeptidase [Arcobacter cloacae]QKF91075.1 peptidase M14 family metallocarboxypeptidase, succinylglutamate desuccinylase/aspartoacylase-like protein [Arcobacter cloacae]RXI41206.1 succinylglutamate desuccinylase [Arcobacter cloacae]